MVASSFRKSDRKVSNNRRLCSEERPHAPPSMTQRPASGEGGEGGEEGEEGEEGG